MKPVVLAHLTDLHLRHSIPGPPSHPGRQGRRLFEFLPALLSRVVDGGADFIALTGDVLDTPRWLLKDGHYYHEYDFAEWVRWVRDDYARLKAMLDQTGRPYCVLPGNHDHPALFRERFPERFQSVPLGGYHICAFHDWNYRSSVPRRLDRERKWFDSLLSQGPRGQIHLQHYPILPPIEADYPYNYAEWGELAGRLHDSGRVELCLSGHYHPGGESGWDGGEAPPRYGICPALCEYPFTYDLYELPQEVGGDGIHRTRHTWCDPSGPREKAVFLDRDGCITREQSFFGGPDAIRLSDQAGRALRRLRDMGYRLIIITHQSSVGRGYVTEDVVRWTHDELSRQLAAYGTAIDAFYFSTGAGGAAVLPQYANDKAKKPSPDLIRRAARDHHLDLDQCLVVGDRLTDCLAGRAAGVPAALVRTGLGSQEEAKMAPPGAFPVFDDLENFAQTLLTHGGLHARTG